MKKDRFKQLKVKTNVLKLFTMQVNVYYRKQILKFWRYKLIHENRTLIQSG